MDNGQPACLVKACVLGAGGQWTTCLLGEGLCVRGRWTIEN